MPTTTSNSELAAVLFWAQIDVCFSFQTSLFASLAPRDLVSVRMARAVIQEPQPFSQDDHMRFVLAVEPFSNQVPLGQDSVLISEV